MFTVVNIDNALNTSPKCVLLVLLYEWKAVQYTSGLFTRTKEKQKSKHAKQQIKIND